MQPPFPSPVPTWHNDLYPAIDPSKDPQSHAGQTVVITGAGSGIGRSTAKAFATAGASHIVLLGRTASTLDETKSEISSSAKVSTFVTDVTSEEEVKKIADTIGTWDVLVLNAGYMPAPTPAAKADIGDYWKAYETNVKSLIIFAKYFFPTASPSRASMLAVVSGSIVLPTKMLIGLSAYQNSKLALIKTVEYLSVENPNIFCSAVHPGMVDTKIFRKSGATPEVLPMDTAELPAGFMVWLSRPEAQFLNGKFVWVNWDVEELKEKAEEIAAGQDLTAGIYGWPFPHVGGAPGA